MIQDILSTKSAKTTFSENNPTNLSSAPSVAPPLSAIVTARTSGDLADKKIFRRYAGQLTTSSVVGGSPESDPKAILYEVGRRFSDNSVFNVETDAEKNTQQVVKTSVIMSQELVNFNKKFTNYTGKHDFMDLSAVAFTLAVAIAKYSYTGVLSCEEIRAGQPVLVRAVHTRADPVQAADGAIFMPRSAAVDSSFGAFAAIAAAANAWGATIYTDILEVDGNNAPVLAQPQNQDLALGCVYGLRILLSQYDACESGPDMAFAVTKGVHHALSVVAHTDEGGYVRDVLRTRSFNRPFGAIFTSEVKDFVGLPMPQLEIRSSFRAFIDSIAIGSAAIVAVAAPLTQVDGRTYPCVYTSRRTALVESGGNVECTVDDVLDIAGQIAATCGNFSQNYISALGTLFNVTGKGDQAISMLTACFTTASSMMSNSVRLRRATGKSGITPDSVNRHLSSVSVAPWFWIEPTTIVRSHFDRFDAVAAGYAQLSTPGEKTEYPMFESVASLDDRGSYLNLAHSWRTARTNALIVHLNNHLLDGLSALTPKQFLKDKVCLPGGTDTIEHKRTAGDDVASYLWGRGQSPLPAPAEFMYLGSLMGSMVRRTYIDDYRDMQVRSVHFPNYDEISSGTVEMTCSMPSEIPSGPSNTWTRAIRRARTTANTALSNAREAVSAGYRTGGSEFIVGDFEPAKYDAPKDVVVTLGDFELHVTPGTDRPPVVVKRGAPAPIVFVDQTHKVSASKSKDNPKPNRPSAKSSKQIVKSALEAELEVMADAKGKDEDTAESEGLTNAGVEDSPGTVGEGGDATPSPLAAT